MVHPIPPLRAYRKAQAPKITLRDLAEKIGVSEAQLSRIEREGTDRLTVARKLSETTGLPIETFAKPVQDAA